jgi:hypothetical protein
MRFLALALSVVLVVAGSATARAGDPGRVSPAKRTLLSRAHYEAGLARFNAGNFEEAVREFELGYQLRALPLFLFNIAQAARRAGQLQKALDHYERYLQEQPAASERAEVELRIAQLRAQLAAAAPPAPAEPPPPAIAPAAATVTLVAPAPPPPEAPRRKRTGVWVTLGVVGAVLLAGAVTAVAVTQTAGPSIPKTDLGNIRFGH